MQRLNKVLAEATLSTSCARVARYLSPSGSEGVGGSGDATFAISKLAMAASIDLVINMRLLFTDPKIVFFLLLGKLGETAKRRLSTY